MMTTRREATSRSVAIKMGQPRAACAAWGDFYYAYSLKKSLRALGWDARVLFRDDLSQAAEREIVLLGLDMNSYVPLRSNRSIAWLISHPDSNTPEVLSRYRKAYVSSLTLAREWGFEFLGQAFDSSVHYAAGRPDPSPFPVAFIGNARAGDRTALLNRLERDVPGFHLWGNSHEGRRNWNGPLPWMRTGEVFRSTAIIDEP